MDKLGVFYADQTFMCLGPLSELRVRLAHCETGLNPPVKYLYLPSRGGTFFVDHMCYLCLIFAMLSRLFMAAVW